jgi:hypothetical protein
MIVINFGISAPIISHAEIVEQAFQVCFELHARLRVSFNNVIWGTCLDSFLGPHDADDRDHFIRGIHLAQKQMLGSRAASLHHHLK